jgi:hypothetical protein
LGEGHALEFDLELVGDVTIEHRQQRSSTSSTAMVSPWSHLLVAAAACRHQAFRRCVQLFRSGCGHPPLVGDGMAETYVRDVRFAATNCCQETSGCKAREEVASR